MMNVDAEIYFYLQMGRMPLFLVLFCGAVFAAVRARSQPQASTLTVVALTIALGFLLAGPLITQFIFQNAATGVTELRLRVLINALMNSVPQAIVYALLLWAVFRVPQQR